LSRIDCFPDLFRDPPPCQRDAAKAKPAAGSRQPFATVLWQTVGIKKAALKYRAAFDCIIWKA